jgi:mitochondrial splicing suppressor protein 51
MATMQPKCAGCKKEMAFSSIKPCDKCKATLYCSRECKKDDWKVHKKACSKQANANSFGLTPPNGLAQPISKPFTRLFEKKWLHDRPEDDVYRVLIDAYRLSVHDELVLHSKTASSNIDVSLSDMGLRRLLDHVESREGMMPAWWTVEKRQACLALASEDSQWYSLKKAVDRTEIAQQYGSEAFLMELRIFIESATGRGPGGFEGAPFLEALVEGEQALENMRVQWA